ncbi:hypothetical protein V473_03220 [Sphingobium cupriresistens LL01]|uniref:Uncharacterized protein n=1 Tax=Sphingobium cupriresistens LL01 TaxID=1420583 RepID=A0A0J7Y0B8_9SPHN|nr:hypothetical protein V473_03220 [Sphingobium cupriresistens LL01]
MACLWVAVASNCPPAWSAIMRKAKRPVSRRRANWRRKPASAQTVSNRLGNITAPLGWCRKALPCSARAAWRRPAKAAGWTVKTSTSIACRSPPCQTRSPSGENRAMRWM